MDIVHVYTKQRKKFGKPCSFTEKPAELLVDIQPDESLGGEFVKKNPSHQEVQCAPEMSEHEVRYSRPVFR
jgi:dynein intermediate chain 2, axonemal